VSRSRKTRVILTVLGLFLFYILGIVARQKSGFRMVIRNESGEVLHQVSLKVENRGKRYELPGLAPGQRKCAFVEPVGKSHITLEFADARNVRHVETAAEYVFADDRGGVTVTVNPGGTVNSTTPTYPLVCWESWLGLICADASL
jgi:hypothetical protein